jgi:hypothetical protein
MEINKLVSLTKKKSKEEIDRILKGREILNRVEKTKFEKEKKLKKKEKKEKKKILKCYFFLVKSL